MNVYEVSKEYTREEFLKEVKTLCPSEFGLNNDGCDKFDKCYQCIEASLKDIQFKDEEDKIIEESNNEKWIFNLEQFKEENIAIKCNTPEESIKFSALHNDKDNFDITKIKSITLDELLLKREFKTGDILCDNEKHVGILLDGKIFFINIDCQVSFNPKSYCGLIPVENIKCIPYFSNDLSKYLNTKDYSILRDYFIKIEEPPKLKTIYSISFTSETNNSKDFILEDDNSIKLEINDIIECCTGSAYQYGRVVDVIQKELKEHEISTYRVCRRLTK